MDSSEYSICFITEFYHLYLTHSILLEFQEILADIVCGSMEQRTFGRFECCIAGKCMPSPYFMGHGD